LDPTNSSNQQQSLATKAVRSGAWLYGRNIVTSLINLGVMAVLARQLTPADFGLVALAEVLLSLVINLSGSTVGPYIIQDRKEGWEERAQAAFWLNLTLVTGVCVLLTMLSPWVSKFYSEALLTGLILVMVGRFFLSQLGVVAEALIKRDLHYSKLVFRDSVLQVFSAVLSILMVLNGWGIWSLVIPGLIAAIPRVIMVLYMAHWVPKLPLRVPLWREIFAYIKYANGALILGTLLNDGDTLVIGRLMDSYSLGIYDRAWNTPGIILKNLTGIVNEISLPSFATIKADPETLRRAYNKTLTILAIVSFPLLVGLFVLADEFIVTLYGSQWVASVPLLRIFIPFALQRSIASPVGVIYLVTGRPDVGFKISLTQLPIYFACILIGSLYGVTGIAIGVTLSRTFFGMVGLYLSCRLIDLSFTRLVKTLWRPLEISLLMGLAVGLLKIFTGLIVPLPPVVSLFVFTTIGGVVFLGLLLTRYRSLLDDVLFVLDNFHKPFALRVRLWVGNRSSGS
jgi:O-antigen/teichoic acid export membrane protein